MRFDIIKFKVFNFQFWVVLLTVPSWLTRITEEICEKTNLFPSPINHVLINEYLPDQGIMVCMYSVFLIVFGTLDRDVMAYELQGSCFIMTQGLSFFFQPHQDGPAYFPVVAIISLGSPVVIDFSPHLSLNESSRNTDPCMVHDPLFDEKTATILDENSELLESFSLVLNPRSLLIFKDHAYSGVQNFDLCFWVFFCDNRQTINRITFQIFCMV